VLREFIAVARTSEHAQQRLETFFQVTSESGDVPRSIRTGFLKSTHILEREVVFSSIDRGWVVAVAFARDHSQPYFSDLIHVVVTPATDVVTCIDLFVPQKLGINTSRYSDLQNQGLSLIRGDVFPPSTGRNVDMKSTGIEPGSRGLWAIDSSLRLGVDPLPTNGADPGPYGTSLFSTRWLEQRLLNIVNGTKF
jgi:hypothetical protein